MPSINTGIPGETPQKIYAFDKARSPSAIPRASPAATRPNKSAILNSAERRASSSRRAAHYATLDAVDPTKSYSSPEPTGGRPTTSRGTRNPNPDHFADYVVRSPTAAPATGEVMHFQKDARMDARIDAAGMDDAGMDDGDDQPSKLRFDFEESVESSHDGWGLSEVNNSYDYGESDEEATGGSDSENYNNSSYLSDNIFVNNEDEEGMDEPPREEMGGMDQQNSVGALEKLYAAHGRQLLALALSL